MADDPPGCLGILLKMFGVTAGSPAINSEALPYRQCDNFLSAAELAFFQVLKQVAGDRFYVCAKVRISDLLYVVNRRNNMGHANRIDRKHVDFVLCDPNTMQPVLVVELDDASHQRKDRQERDELVDAAFGAAELPILHVVCRQRYRVEDLKQQIKAAFKPVGSDLTMPPPIAITHATLANQTSAPICPKCNVAMVERKASRGNHRGKRFWACPSYPDCRKIVAID